MTPEKHMNLAESLKNMRAARNLSLAEFSRELDIPKSTLQSIMEDGQTSLHTAIHISEKLGIPLDMLINGRMSERSYRMLDGLMTQLGWRFEMPKEDWDEACRHFFALVKIIEKHHG